LGDNDVKGPAFEQVRPALEYIAKKRASKHAQPLSNDRALELFIDGKVGVYCGGAINSLLLDTWWHSAAPMEFIEFLCHAEIEKGFHFNNSEDGNRETHRKVINYLDFDIGDHSRLKRLLTNLFRVIGRGLSDWAQGVRDVHAGPTDNLAPCRAACYLLRPLHREGVSKHAFVTALTDPASLILQDTFFEPKKIKAKSSQRDKQRSPKQETGVINMPKRATGGNTK
jgi:hypothetical protein